MVFFFSFISKINIHFGEIGRAREPNTATNNIKSNHLELILLLPLLCALHFTWCCLDCCNNNIIKCENRCLMETEQGKFLFCLVSATSIFRAFDYYYCYYYFQMASFIDSFILSHWAQQAHDFVVNSFLFFWFFSLFAFLFFTFYFHFNFIFRFLFCLRFSTRNS